MESESHMKNSPQLSRDLTPSIYGFSRKYMDSLGVAGLFSLVIQGGTKDKVKSYTGVN